MATRMQQRRGTASQWTTADPILNAGEIGFESDTNKFKIGDGINHWADLAYFVDIDTMVAGAPGLLDTINELAAAINDDPNFFSTVATNLSNHEADTTNVHGITDTAELATKAFAASLLTGATKSNITITGDKNGLTITAENGVADSTTDNLTEGSTNKYFTDERAQDAVGNAVGSGLSYNDSTGAISVDTTAIQAVVSGVSNTEIGYLDGVTSAIQTQLNSKAPTADPTFTGTVSGVTKSHVGLGNVDNTSDANKPVSTATQTALDLKAPKADPTFTGTATTNNLIVDGDFTVNGTNFSASATSITIEDNLVQIAHQNPANTVDLGIVVGYNDGTAKHAGLVKDTSASTWKLFKGVTTEPATTVDFTEGSLDDLAVAGLTASSLTVGDVSNTEFSYLNGVTSAIQTQLDAKIAKEDITAKGVILVGTGAGTYSAQSVGTNGQVLTANSAQADGVEWTTISGYSAPTLGTTSIASGATVTTIAGLTLSNSTLSGTLTAGGGTGTSGQYLESTGTGVRWTTVTGYSAPTLGSTSIASGATVTTISGLTQNNSTLTGTLTAGGSAGISGMYLQSTATGVRWAREGATVSELLLIGA